ncbi:hypothetical protein ACIP5R_41990, partial [Streptomyces sp. NPDC088775]
RRIRRLTSHQDTFPWIYKIHCQSVHVTGVASVFGGNQKLRIALEGRGSGYVLAVAQSHDTTHAGMSRAGSPAKKLPAWAWQKLSAEAKGQRFYDRADIDLPDPLPARCR